MVGESHWGIIYLSKQMAHESDLAQQWLAKFLWHFSESGMSNGEAAEIIVSNLAGRLPCQTKAELSPLKDPKLLFQEWDKLTEQN